MTFKKQLIYALLTAVLAFIVTYGTQAVTGWPLPASYGKGLTYISFVCWACYFVCGDVKGAGNWIASMAAGIFCGILMLVLTFALTGALGGLAAVSAGVAILVIFMMFADRIKINGTALFIGTGLYFSLFATGALTTFTAGEYCIVGIAELLYAAIGLFAGWVTIKINVWATKLK